MNKDQFWEIIDNINQSGPFANETEYRKCVSKALDPCSMEDLLDWENMMQVYADAARRLLLYETLLENEPECTDYDFTKIRFWLISCGKEAYMQALRSPEGIPPLPESWEDHALGFFYASDIVYDQKQRALTDGQPGKLIRDPDKHPLSSETEEAIHEELQREAPSPPTPVVAKPQSPSSIADLVSSGNFLYAYVEVQNGVTGTDRWNFVFLNTPENIAHFLGNYRYADIIIEDANDNKLLTAEGNCILYCRDEQLRVAIEKTLAPIRWEEVEPEPFFCPEYREVKPYLEQQADMSEPQNPMQSQMQL